MKTAIALILLMSSVPAAAQQRSIYNDSGKLVGRSVTDSQGNITFYNNAGRVTHRMSPSGTITTIYGADGRKTGTIDKPSR